MFKVITTGMNLNYGKKGEIRLLGDTFVIYAIKKNWIKPKIEWIEDGQHRLKIIDTKRLCRRCGLLVERSK